MTTWDNIKFALLFGGTLLAIAAFVMPFFIMLLSWWFSFIGFVT